MGHRKPGPLARLCRWVRLKIWCWQIDRHIEKIYGGTSRKAAAIPQDIRSLRGWALNHHVWEWAGIKRRPGETDEELRLRYVETVRKEYEGSLVVPMDDLLEQLAAAYEMPPEILTGRQEPKTTQNRRVTHNE